MLTVAMTDLGDPATRHDLEETFREYAQFIYRTAHGVTGSREDAEDVLQSIFLRLLRREFPASLGSNPKAYLYRAAVNESLNALRSHRRHPLVEAPEGFDAPMPATEAEIDNELHRQLYEAIAELKPETAHILVLRYVHGYSDAQIAKMLGVSRGAIALKLFRSRVRLKKLLARKTGR